jgi:GNAT superfamily N-acetyltransferase
VRDMTADEVAAVVDAHIAAFPDFNLTRLGPSFLREYYAAVQRDASAIALVAERQGEGLLGFVVGSTNPRGFYSRLLRGRWHRFALAAIPALVMRPKAVVQLFRALRYPGTHPEGDGVAGLYSLAVVPERRKQGVGAGLVVRFLDEAWARGADQVYLQTDADDNEGVNLFYAALGFGKARTFVAAEDRRMHEYTIERADSSSDPVPRARNVGSDG